MIAIFNSFMSEFRMDSSADQAKTPSESFPTAFCVRIFAYAFAEASLFLVRYLTRNITPTMAAMPNSVTITLCTKPAII